MRSLICLFSLFLLAFCVAAYSGVGDNLTAVDVVDDSLLAGVLRKDASVHLDYCSANASRCEGFVNNTVELDFALSIQPDRITVFNCRVSEQMTATARNPLDETNLSVYVNGRLVGEINSSTKATQVFNFTIKSPPGSIGSRTHNLTVAAVYLNGSGLVERILLNVTHKKTMIENESTINLNESKKAFDEGESKITVYEDDGYLMNSSRELLSKAGSYLGRALESFNSCEFNKSTTYSLKAREQVDFALAQAYMMYTKVAKARKNINEARGEISVVEGEIDFYVGQGCRVGLVEADLNKSKNSLTRALGYLNTGDYASAGEYSQLAKTQAQGALNKTKFDCSLQGIVVDVGDHDADDNTTEKWYESLQEDPIEGEYIPKKAPEIELEKEGWGYSNVVTMYTLAILFYVVILYAIVISLKRRRRTPR